MTGHALHARALHASGFTCERLYIQAACQSAGWPDAWQQATANPHYLSQSNGGLGRVCSPNCVSVQARLAWLALGPHHLARDWAACVRGFACRTHRPARSFPGHLHPVGSDRPLQCICKVCGGIRGARRGDAIRVCAEESKVDGASGMQTLLYSCYTECC
jgi:hypothetical protein